MVIFQNRYIQAAQQLMRLWSGARGAGAGPVVAIQTELNALAEQVGVDLELAHRLTPDSLVLLVAPAGAADPLRCWLLAEMFYLSGRLAERDEDAARARESDRRALQLFERVVSEPLPDVELPDPRERIAELKSGRAA